MAIAALLFLIPPAVAVGHDLYIDDGCAPGTGGPLFWASGPAAYWEVITGSGWNNCHLRTLVNKDDVPVNEASWYLDSTPENAWKYNHVYSTHAYVASDGSTYTAQAIYRVYAFGTANGVTDVHTLDQANNQSGFCYWLGSNQFSATNGGYVRAIDLSTYPGYLYVDIFCYTTTEGH